MPRRADFGVFSVCDTRGCPNRGKVAHNPRSDDDPKHCGMCGEKVRFIRGEHRVLSDANLYESIQIIQED